jgi:DNA-binding response OmpR family regulator
LIVAQDQVLIENLKRELPLEKSFKVAVASSGFEAGIQAESFNPDCMIVDFSIGKVEALQICQNLRKNIDFSEIILIALLPDDGNVMSFDRSSINETFKKPFDARLLAERLRTLIGNKKELV